MQRVIRSYCSMPGKEGIVFSNFYRCLQMEGCLQAIFVGGTGRICVLVLLEGLLCDVDGCCLI